MTNCVRKTKTENKYMYKGNRPLSHGRHFESQENKKLCFCPSSLALNERLDGKKFFVSALRDKGLFRQKLVIYVVI